MRTKTKVSIHPGKLAALLFLLQLTISTFAFAGWETLPPFPAPNGGFACGVLAGKIVVLGGTNWKDNTKHWLDVIWVFDPASGRWKSWGRLPHPLAYPVAANWQGDLILAGGTDGTRPRREVWRMNPSLALSRIGELADASAVAVGGVLHDNLIFVGGCTDLGTFEGLRRDAVRFNLRDASVSSLSGPGTVPFCLAASVSAGDQLFIFGGATLDPTKQIVNLNQAWACVAPGMKWRSLRPCPLSLRGASAVQLDQHHLLIAGGYGGQPEDFIAAALIYDTEKDVFARTSVLPTPALVGLVRLGDYVYSLGGEDKMKHRTDACYRAKVRELLSSAKKNP
jgi:N-acetylneuraminic acid mutarotase